MSSTDWITLAISLISVVIAVWAALKAERISAYELRLSRRFELHTMLLELDREVLHDPTLFLMFRSCPVSIPPPVDPLHIAKQDAYVSMCLNLFEVSFAQFKELRRISRVEREISEAWDRFIISFFADCSRARPVWGRYRDTYYASFRDYIDKLIVTSELLAAEPMTPSHAMQRTATEHSQKSMESQIDQSTAYSEACNTLRHYSQVSSMVRVATVAQGLAILIPWANALTQAQPKPVVAVALPIAGLILTVLLFSFNKGYFDAAAFFYKAAAKMEQKFFDEDCRPMAAYDAEHERKYASAASKSFTLYAPFVLVGTLFILALLTDLVIYLSIK